MIDRLIHHADILSLKGATASTAKTSAAGQHRQQAPHNGGAAAGSYARPRLAPETAGATSRPELERRVASAPKLVASSIAVLRECRQGANLPGM